MNGVNISPPNMSNNQEILAKISDENFLDEDDTDAWTPHKISKLWEIDSKFHSPINLDVVKATRVELPCLVWCEYDKLPKKIKITNSGSTLILSAKWHSVRPNLSGGCLPGKYTLSQIHFHWGKTAFEGSEHSADDTFYPLEMHAVHFKSVYKSQQEAIKYHDGLLTVAYLFQLMSQHSPVMYPILSKIPDIRTADTATHLEPFLMSDLTFPFPSDYYLYWGNVTTEICDSNMLWIITRDTCYISYEQLQQFHLLMDPKLRPIYSNFRQQSPHWEHLFHVNPKYKYTLSTLSRIPLRLDPDNSECNQKEIPVLEAK